MILIFTLLIAAALLMVLTKVSADLSDFFKDDSEFLCGLLIIIAYIMFLSSILIGMVGVLLGVIKTALLLEGIII
jgi:hypothetical protein